MGVDIISNSCSVDDNKNRFLSLLKTVNRDGIQDLIEWLNESDFFTAPASRSYHGSYVGGLCEHSLNVYDELVRLLQVYPEIKVQDDTVIISSLLHDLCKVNFYIVEKRNRKNNETGRWESVDAFAIDEKFCFGGHGSKSMYLAQHFIKLTPEEAVAINNHMSAFQSDANDVGRAFDAFPFAWLLSVADQSACYIKEGKGN